MKRTSTGLVNPLETWAVFHDNRLLPLLFPHNLTSRSQRKVVNYIPLSKKGFKKKCTLALLSRGSDGWGSDLFAYRWAHAKEWKKYSGEEFSNGRMRFKDSFYYMPTTSGGVTTGQGKHTINNEVSWGKNCCILRENCGWDRSAKSVTCIVYVFESRFHISFSVTGKDFNFFFFKTNYLDLTPTKKPKTLNIWSVDTLNWK